MNLVKRSFFGWPVSSARSANPTKGLVIHYDGPGNHLTEKKHDECISYWKKVRKYHMNEHGWLDIGYSFGVCPHGYTFEGRGIGKEQAAQPTGNTTFYSNTLMLGDGERPTSLQIESTRELLKWLVDSHSVEKVVKGHRDFISTSCPGSILYAMVKDGTFTKPNPWDAKDAAKQIQTKFNQLGYKPRLVVDNIYGPLTKKAVEWFQKNHPPLVVDGIVGKNTWKALFG